MSSFKLSNFARAAWLTGTLAILSACTAGPLYAPTSLDPVTGARSSILSDLAGRIAVAAADTRTSQLVRNALLFRLNGAEPVRDPLYEIRYTTLASDQTVSIQGGSGVPTASLYRLQVNFTLVRLADGATLASGERFSTAPYDRSEQLFAVQRAVIDARENAARDIADRITLTIAPVLQREAFAATPSPVVPKG